MYRKNSQVFEYDRFVTSERKNYLQSKLAFKQNPTEITRNYSHHEVIKKIDQPNRNSFNQNENKNQGCSSQTKHLRTYSDFSKSSISNHQSISWAAKQLLENQKIKKQNFSCKNRFEELENRIQLLEKHISQDKNQSVLQIIQSKTSELNQINSNNFQQIYQLINRNFEHFLVFKGEVEKQIFTITKFINNHEKQAAFNSQKIEKLLSSQAEQKILNSKELLQNKIKTEVCQLEKKILNQLSKSIPKKQSQTLQFFRSNRKYHGNPISFAYEEYIKKQLPVIKNKFFIEKKTKSNDKQNQEENQNTSPSSCINKLTYNIDPDGYLLDSSLNYLVNGQAQLIKISDRELKILKKLNIIESENEKSNKCSRVLEELRLSANI